LAAKLDGVPFSEFLLRAVLEGLLFAEKSLRAENSRMDLGGEISYF